MPSIYRITYPNGKIYVGKDLTDTVAYFGSVDSGLIQADFRPGETDVFTITKEILRGQTALRRCISGKPSSSATSSRTIRRSATTDGRPSHPE